MPLAVFKCIREVSSEDSICCAGNLLKQDVGKKWKTKSVGEKSAYVILELEEPAQITGIDIGNYHSAFVEVLVGKASCRPEDFTEILITCSFMTPIESKNSSIPNRVRCFNQEALVSTAVSNKWRLIKVICTQPFNKHVQYGLSFIKVHIAEKAEQQIKEKCLVPEKFLLRKSSTESNESAGKTCPKLSPFGLGKITLRGESPDSESESTSALFGRWKTSRNNDGALTTAAAIREASSPTALRRLSESSTLIKPVMKAKSTSNSSKTPVDGAKVEENILDRNRDRLLFGDDGTEDEEPAKKLRLEKHIEADKERLRIENDKQQKDNAKRKNIVKPQQERKTATKAQTTTLKQENSLVQKETRDSNKLEKKRQSSPSNRPSKKVKATTTTKYRPFNQLLRGVVLVISGIQNPDRSELRNKALALGAKYKADWGKDCTHLICAFKNTPKYNQVKGHGKIVTRSWIEKCYSLKKYLPWRRYAMDSSELTNPESDEEILDETLKSISDLDEYESDNDERDKQCTIATTYDLTDADEQVSHNQRYDISSESDTEDEIERVITKKKISLNNRNEENSAGHKNPQKRDDIYNASTDEEDYLKKKIKINIKSGTFFKNFNFYISNNVNIVDKIKLEKFIVKYAGHLTSDLSKAHYFISDTLLESAETGSFTGETVKPLWIFECNNLETKVSTSRYLILT